MADYVTTDQIAAFSQEFAALKDLDAQALLATAASRLFDNLCEVPENFFQLADTNFTTRDYYGDGTAYLTVDPFTALNTVTPVVIDPDPDVNYTLPAYTAIDNQLIVLDKTKQQSLNAGGFTNRFTGWNQGVKVTVSAKWGWSAIPADVQLATIALAIVQWRTADPAFAVISSAEAAYTRTASLSDVHKNTIENYKARFNRNALFA